MEGLEVKELRVSYGKAKVLFGISLEIKVGKVVIIVGKNGAGKTTLFRTIAGFLKPQEGSIVFKGKDVTGLPPYTLAGRGIKYIPQDKSVFSDLTVKENLDLSAFATKDFDFDRVLAFFPQLEPLLHRKAGKLSGGERQMLLIARALLGRPELLLMDEPSEGLSPSVAAALYSSLEKIRKETTLFIIEQNLPLVAQIADEVYAIKEGKIVNKTSNQEEIKGLTFRKYL